MLEESEIRFLAEWMDSKLTIASQIKKVTDKCKKGYFKMLGRGRLGCNPTGTEKSILCNGKTNDRLCQDSMASVSLLKKVSCVQSQALRIGSGSLRTSPVSAMPVEMAELP